MTEDNVHRLWTDEELDEGLILMRPGELANRQPLAEARNTLLNAVRSLEGRDTLVADTNPVTEPTRKPGLLAGRRWWLSAAAAVVVVAVGATVAITGGDHGDPSPQPTSSVPAVKFASVQQALDKAADKIHVTGEAPIPAGKFRYTETRGWYLVASKERQFAFLAEELRQTWQPSEFDSEWLLKIGQTGNKQWLVGNEQTPTTEGQNKNEIRQSGEWRARGGQFPEKALIFAGRGAGEWSAPTKQQLADLPRDPQQLYELMLKDPFLANKPRGGGVLAVAATLLKTGVVPADLKEAVYRAVAKIPGLKITAQVANLDGRKGVALGVTPPDGTYLYEIIVDCDTGEFIGERTTQFTPGGDGGIEGIKADTVTSYSSVHTAITDQAGTVPAGN
ncbi:MULTISPECIES: CU044_5270 family protein [unclassified Amycolatopsis]|uniref:CU044_5270 family protein n=1 Tax=unclassified Amycolatopsis TaxID=2618356 RepID=UPI002E24869D|nr:MULTISPECIES: CU044_5270 family protein [unclassified Amycolatopsis]